MAKLLASKALTSQHRGCAAWKTFISPASASIAKSDAWFHGCLRWFSDFGLKAFVGGLYFSTVPKPEGFDTTKT